jgi:nitronate monooxygenase
MMWPRTDLIELLGIDHPIIQAPMAGSDGLRQLREKFDETRSSTSRPFNINFFAHHAPEHPSDAAATMREWLSTYYEELGLQQSLTLSDSPMRSFDADTLEAVLELQPRVVSFHFGLPAAQMLGALKATGTIILCAATTVSEARQLEASGVHAIIAQGCDAGGHRGTFSIPLETGSVGTFALVPQIVDAVSVPVIAAGGIADGRGVAAAFALGASGVQMGTAFLPCPESAASPVHREALRHVRAEDTTLSRAFTGRPARTIVNRFVEEMASRDGDVAPFPLQDSLTLPLHIRSVERESKNFAALFCGQAASLNRTLPAGALVDALVAETRAIFNR